MSESNGGSGCQQVTYHMARKQKREKEARVLQSSLRALPMGSGPITRCHSLKDHQFSVVPLQGRSPWEDIQYLNYNSWYRNIPDVINS
jgi:hypothetical protein